MCGTRGMVTAHAKFHPGWDGTVRDGTLVLTVFPARYQCTSVRSAAGSRNVLATSDKVEEADHT